MDNSLIIDLESDAKSDTNVDESSAKDETKLETAVPATKKKAPTKKPKKRKKKIPKDFDAPKFPLTGYVRYTNEHREEVRKKFPNVTPMEITKLLAEDWNKLTEEEKKPYLKAAEIDKVRYNKEINDYNKQNEEKSKKTNESSCEKIKDSSKVTEKPTVNGKDVKKESKNGEIPIFTEEFLDHNKMIDSELRILRKSNTDYEQQNAVLEKHVENMHNGVEKLESEMSTLKEHNVALSSYLGKLKQKLANALSGLSLPGHPNGATIENIEEYMTELQEMTTSNPHQYPTINKAKDIIRKLDLQIQL